MFIFVQMVVHRSVFFGGIALLSMVYRNQSHYIEAIFVSFVYATSRSMQLHCPTLQLCPATRLHVRAARQNRRSVSLTSH